MADQSGLLILSQDGSGDYEDHQRVLAATDTLVLVAALTANFGITIDTGFGLSGNGALSVNSGGSGNLSMVPANDFVVDLPDAAGARSLLVKDSGSATVFSINSDGDVVIQGDLTVNGANLTVEGTTVQYEDSLLLFAKDQTGSASIDVGFIGERGDDTNIAFVWDESADTFVCISTTDTGGTTTISNFTDYVDLRVGALVADDSIQIAGGVTATAILDEDAMGSDSATALATQQSIKAYVDAAVAGADTFAELSDTTIAGLAGGHIAIYDGSDSWDNKAFSGDGTLATTGAFALTATSNATLTSISSLVTVGALASGSIADGFGGIAMNDSELLLTGSANLQMGDSALMTFGTGDDVTMRWDGTDFDVLAAADDSVIHWGADNGNAFDQHWHGEATGDAMVFDASANTFTLSDIDLILDNGAIFTLGAAALAMDDILDEDAMGSNSATALATQQSIKAYVDAQVGAPEIADGSEQLFAGYTAATIAPAAANNLLFAVTDETSALKARLLDVTSTLATSRCAGVWRTGAKAVKSGRCSAVLLENTVGCTIGDQLVASANTNGRVTRMGETGAPGSMEHKVVVGWAESTVSGGTDETCKASLHIQPPVLL